MWYWGPKILLGRGIFLCLSQGIWRSDWTFIRHWKQTEYNFFNFIFYQDGSKNSADIVQVGSILGYNLKAKIKDC